MPIVNDRLSLVRSQVPQVQPTQPLQQFFVEYPGLTGFIGRCVLSYYSNHNTTSLEGAAGFDSV